MVGPEGSARSEEDARGALISPAASSGAPEAPLTASDQMPTADGGNGRGPQQETGAPSIAPAASSGTPGPLLIAPAAGSGTPGAFLIAPAAGSGTPGAFLIAPAAGSGTPGAPLAASDQTPTPEVGNGRGSEGEGGARLVDPTAGSGTPEAPLPASTAAAEDSERGGELPRSGTAAPELEGEGPAGSEAEGDRRGALLRAGEEGTAPGIEGEAPAGFKAEGDRSGAVSRAGDEGTAHALEGEAPAGPGPEGGSSGAGEGSSGAVPTAEEEGITFWDWLRGARWGRRARAKAAAGSGQRVNGAKVTAAADSGQSVDESARATDAAGSGQSVDEGASGQEKGSHQETAGESTSTSASVPASTDACARERTTREGASTQERGNHQETAGESTGPQTNGETSTSAGIQVSSGTNSNVLEPTAGGAESSSTGTQDRAPEASSRSCAQDSTTTSAPHSSGPEISTTTAQHRSAPESSTTSAQHSSGLKTSITGTQHSSAVHLCNSIKTGQESAGTSAPHSNSAPESSTTSVQQSSAQESLATTGSSGERGLEGANEEGEGAPSPTPLLLSNSQQDSITTGSSSTSAQHSNSEQDRLGNGAHQGAPQTPLPPPHSAPSFEGQRKVPCAVDGYTADGYTQAYSQGYAEGYAQALAQRKAADGYTQGCTVDESDEYSAQVGLLGGVPEQALKFEGLKKLNGAGAEILGLREISVEEELIYDEEKASECPEKNQEDLEGLKNPEDAGGCVNWGAANTAFIIILMVSVIVTGTVLGIGAAAKDKANHDAQSGTHPPPGSAFPPSGVLPLGPGPSNAKGTIKLNLSELAYQNPVDRYAPCNDIKPNPDGTFPRRVVRIYAEPVRTRWKGWGTSLSWWPRLLESYPDRFYDPILNLVFNKTSGLGLNMVRYQIPAPRNDSLSPNVSKNPRQVQGFLPGPGAEYNWSQDAAQLRVLRDTRRFGVDFFDAIANSPPWWMTLSGDVAGNVGGRPNFNPAFSDAFAAYLADVMQHLKEDPSLGFDFGTVSPANEPLEGWWYNGSHNEGCGYTTQGLGMIALSLDRALRNRSLDTGVSLLDSWTGNTVGALRGGWNGKIPGPALRVVARLAVHGYTAADQHDERAETRNFLALSQLAGALGKDTWQTEWGPVGYLGVDVQFAVLLARCVCQHVNLLKVSAWFLWQAMQQRNGGGWGPIQMPLVILNNTRPRIMRQFYVMRQLIAAMPPGSMPLKVDAACGSGVLAAYQDDTSQLSVTITNQRFQDYPFSLNVSQFTPTKTSPRLVSVFRSSVGENYTLIDEYSFDTTTTFFNVVAQALSVTTLMISGVEPII